MIVEPGRKSNPDCTDPAGRGEKWYFSGILVEGKTTEQISSSCGRQASSACRPLCLIYRFTKWPRRNTCPQKYSPLSLGFPLFSPFLFPSPFPRTKRSEKETASDRVYNREIYPAPLAKRASSTPCTAKGMRIESWIRLSRFRNVSIPVFPFFQPCGCYQDNAFTGIYPSVLKIC